MKIKSAILLGLLYAASAAMGQSNAATTRIAGHVYSFQDGHPLAGVVVTVEKSNQDDQRQLTSKDGSYAFEHLAAGEYNVIAFRRDLIGQIYGITPQGKGTVAFLNMRSGQSRDNTDFHLLASPSITEMPTKAMAAAYPQDFVNLGVAYGRFSPDGTLLAIVTNGIASGDAEQVWLYNLLTQRLFAITQTPVPKVSPMIRSIAWIGNTLYVDGDRRQSTGNFVVKANADGAEEITGVPAAVQKILAKATIAYGRDDSIVGAYSVTLGRRCHGCAPELIARTLNTSQRITISNDINGNFVFDSASPVVFYPVTASNGAILHSTSIRIGPFVLTSQSTVLAI